MPQPPNIVLISADSLRADHLGCYGYHHPTSPRIDGLAADGVTCDRMFCPVIPTQPSHTTLYTGQHPLTHGVLSHGGRTRLARGAPFLPELLLEAGYTTCAVDTLMRERIWFGRGYEYVIDPSIRHVFYASVTCDELNERAIQWLETVPRGPFFLFIHYWDVHYPYVPPRQYNSLFYDGPNPVDPADHSLDEWWTHPIGAMARDTWLATPSGRITKPDYVRALYDREIRYLDDGIAKLMAALDARGLSDNTLFVLLGDHGESMTEHRIYFDHYGLYDSTTRVPFIARWPGRLKSGLRLAPMLQMSDVAPTILEAAGVPIPASMEGRSFFPALAGEAPAAGHTRVISLESTWQAKWALRTDTHKFILSREQDLLGTPMRELYDLTADPNEAANIAGDDAARAASLEEELEEWIAAKLQATGRTDDPVKTETPSMLATWMRHRAS